jgi:hypothetical protein
MGFILIVQQFHEGMMAQTSDDDETSAHFPSQIKHGCVLGQNSLQQDDVQQCSQMHYMTMNLTLSSYIARVETVD